ncbi:hypothetical protein F7R91_34045 [Streptomyces luteolifulvus]|uniref:DUF4386 family protein n=1 Tax=Streptomyces luteolifulvus TaxID=2615112 RepID=A0A6H9UQS2_9ACTN|nr:hypothetical protein [Streptomyces luteolifulvus]KAB1140198.1 hypothetical protein F7R91_36725 [Streptomyces luteolifulvus]KAB1141040.1 hypothetical protein F7R91_34045 [Streptomyces luteolifulvus]
MQLKRGRLGTPRAAGTAGVVFAVLMATTIILVRTALPSGGGGDEIDVTGAQLNAVQTALELLPFAGIAFLWFMGAVREQAGEGEDRFVSTVFLGSGLIFAAILFVSGAAVGTVLDESQNDATFGRHFAYTLLTTYAMRMAAVFILTASTIARRLGALPRPLVAFGLLAGLTLLVVGSSVPWSELVFPAWALVVSLHILRGRRAGPQPATPT